MALQVPGNMAGEDIIGSAFSVLNTVMQFIEYGDVGDLIENEIKNYFMMCQQIEIFSEKFMQKGYFLAHDKERGAYLTATTSSKADFDCGLLADRLLQKFCHPQHSNTLLTSAVRMYIDYYGSSRFTRFIEVLAATKHAFNLTTLIDRASDNGYNLEGPVFMECLEKVAMSQKGGMPRVRDFISEFLADDLCAETIVDMLATENKSAEFLTDIKHVILEKLEVKLSCQPKGRIWLKIVCSLNLISAVNNFTPFVPFVLKLVGLLSESITYDPVKDTYHSPPACLTYKNLVHIMAKFYRNPQTTQAIVNFVFNQFKTDSTVWGSVLTACHNHPIEPTTSDMFFESLYKDGFTDPNVSSESLQLILKAILNVNSKMMTEALEWKSNCKCDLRKDQDTEPGLPGSSDGAMKPEKWTEIGVDCPIKTDEEARDLEIKPHSQSRGPAPDSPPPGSQIVVTTVLAGVAAAPSKKWTVVELERRSLSSRIRRAPKHFDDFWA